MNGTIVYKMTGSGNDFVFVDGRTSPLDGWGGDRIESVCRRRTGVGADGLVVLTPGTQLNHVGFNFFNRDGARAEMCGNASLCAVRLATRLEMVARGADVVLETDAGLVTGRCLDEPAERAEIDLADLDSVAEPDIDTGPGEQLIRYAVVGVPHLVVVVDDVDAASVAPTVRGRALRSHPAVGTAGANVNFLAQAAGEWRMRTFERGVEDETLACGTGAVAAAAILAHAGRVTFPWRVRTQSGSTLGVDAEITESGLKRPRLSGEGRIVFRGIVT